MEILSSADPGFTRVAHSILLSSLSSPCCVRQGSSSSLQAAPWQGLSLRSHTAPFLCTFPLYFFSAPFLTLAEGFQEESRQARRAAGAGGGGDAASPSHIPYRCWEFCQLSSLMQIRISHAVFLPSNLNSTRSICSGHLSGCYHVLSGYLPILPVFIPRGSLFLGAMRAIACVIAKPCPRAPATAGAKPGARSGLAVIPLP